MVSWSVRAGRALLINLRQVFQILLIISGNNVLNPVINLVLSLLVDELIFKAERVIITLILVRIVAHSVGARG